MTLLIALVISLVPPTVYLFLEIRASEATATSYARELEEKLRSFALESPTLWKYQAQKYFLLLDGFLLHKQIADIHILDEAGQSITGYEHHSEESGGWLELNARGRPVPIVFNNRRIGTVRVHVPLDSVVSRSVLFLLVSTLTGLLLALLAHRYPVRIAAGLEDQIQGLLDKLRESHDALELRVAERTAELRRSNHALEIEILERRNAEEALLKAREELENQVQEQTAELRTTNIRLHEEIVEHKRTEDQLRESRDKLRSLSSELITAQEAERKRVATEVHESIGVSLATIKLSLGNILAGIGQDKATAESVKSCIELTQNAIQECRRMMLDLRPSLLDDLGIRETFDWFFREFQTICPTILLKSEIDIVEREIPEPLKIVLFRIIQEIFNGIARQGKVVGSLSTSIFKDEAGMHLILGYDVPAIDPDSRLSSDGRENTMEFRGLKERVELSGGALAIESTMGEGTTIHASWDVQGLMTGSSKPPAIH